MRDTTAAKNLLYRRLRALANHEAAIKQLDKARSKNKDVQAVRSLYLHLYFNLVVNLVCTAKTLHLCDICVVNYY